MKEITLDTWVLCDLFEIERGPDRFIVTTLDCEDWSQLPNFWKGKKRGPQSAETRRKISESKKGGGTWNKGVTGYKSPQPQSAIDTLKRGIICYGVFYPSLKEAAEALGYKSKSTLVYHARGAHPDINYEDPNWKR